MREERFKPTERKVNNGNWYPVPPYRKGGNWKVLNEQGELVAIFENKSDCIRACNAVNTTNVDTDPNTAYIHFMFT